MNLPTEKLYSLGRHKMFKCWKWSSSDPMLVGFTIALTGNWIQHSFEIGPSKQSMSVYLRLKRRIGPPQRKFDEHWIKATADAADMGKLYSAYSMSAQWHSQNEAEEAMPPRNELAKVFNCWFVLVFNCWKDVGDWRYHWLAPPENNSWLRNCVVLLNWNLRWSWNDVCITIRWDTANWCIRNSCEKRYSLFCLVVASA